MADLDDDRIVRFDRDPVGCRVAAVVHADYPLWTYGNAVHVDEEPLEAAETRIRAQARVGFLDREPCGSWTGDPRPEDGRSGHERGHDRADGGYDVGWLH